MTMPPSAVIAQAPVHVRSILAATRDTVARLFAQDAVYVRARVRPADATRTDEVAVIVSIAGAVQGHILLGMTMGVACTMAGTLLGEDLPAFDDMTRSGVAEIANIVAGGCATALHRDGYAVDITVPSVIVGGGVAVTWPTTFVLEAALALPAGEIGMAVGLAVVDA